MDRAASFSQAQDRIICNKLPCERDMPKSPLYERADIMLSWGADLRKLIATVALTFAIGMPCAEAQRVSPPIPVPPSSVGAGPWIVAGIGLSALSVIFRGIVVGQTHKRELTSKEAQEAIFLPFLWLFISPNGRAKTNGEIDWVSGKTQEGWVSLDGITFTRRSR